MSFMYLASPYTHHDPRVRHWRYEAVRDYAAHLIQNRQWVYGAIVHTHDICLNHEMPHEFEFWQDLNHTMIVASTGMIVFQIDGWRQSRGILDEIEFCMKIGRPVIYSTHWLRYDHPTQPTFD